MASLPFCFLYFGHLHLSLSMWLLFLNGITRNRTGQCNVMDHVKWSNVLIVIERIMCKFQENLHCAPYAYPRAGLLRLLLMRLLGMYINCLKLISIVFLPIHEKMCCCLFNLVHSSLMFFRC